MKLYLKLNDISDSMIVFQNRRNSQILIQFNPLHRMRARENLRACKICLRVPICLQGLHITACSESVFSSSRGKERSPSLKDKFRFSAQQTPGAIGHPGMTARNCRAMFAAFISQSNSVGGCEWRRMSCVWPSSWCEGGSRPRSPQKHRGIFTEQKK